jgi:hypothetical protein
MLYLDRDFCPNLHIACMFWVLRLLAIALNV